MIEEGELDPNGYLFYAKLEDVNRGLGDIKNCHCRKGWQVTNI